MKMLLGLLLILIGIAIILGGVYISVWGMLILGIIQFIEGVKADPVNSMNVAVGLVRVWLCWLPSTICFWIGSGTIVGGLAVFADD